MMLMKPHSKKAEKVGYVRVSTTDQNTARQLVEVKGLAGKFTDEASGKDTARPELQKALAYLRAGDTLVVHSMDRLARNIVDLRRLVDELTKRGVAVQFMKENLTFTGEDSPMANLLLSLLGAVSEFERALLLERQREGIAIAKGLGKYLGRKPKLSKAKVIEMKKRAAKGESKTELAEEYGVARQTVYKLIAK